jgi:glycosyltransferase involved in cell wall biosynthesis
MPLTETESSLATKESLASLAAPDRACGARIAGAMHELEQLAELLVADDCRLDSTLSASIAQDLKLSIVIPVFNEQATIRQVLDRVLALPIATEIIVVDDASTDGTRQILAEYEAKRNVCVIFKPCNEGKGAALRTGFRRVTGDVVVVQDADLEYDPADILNVVRPIAAGQADVVYGSRFLNQPEGGRLSIHRLGNACLTMLSNWFTGLDITDMETCYKAFRREVLASFEIRQPRFGFEPEVTARIARRKYRLSEVPIRYAPRSYAQGKKIGVKDLFNALFCIIRYGIAD